MSAHTGRVTLTTPVVHVLRDAAGKKIEERIPELMVRRPLARDLLATDAHEGDAAKSIALFAHLAGVSIETIDGLTGTDFATIGAAVEAAKAIDWPEGSVSKLRLREMFARDLRVTDRQQGETAKSMALVAALAGVDVSTVQALPLGEFEALAGELDRPTPPGRPTGQTASAS